MVNSLNVCEGLITRKRKTIPRTEVAALDFFLVNSVMLPFIEQMKIDVIDEFTLANHAQNRKNGKSVISDHRPLILKLNLEFTKMRPQRLEQYNFKSEECRKLFTEITESTTKLTECCKNNFSNKGKGEMWQKELERVVQQAFQKKRIVTSTKKLGSQNSILLEQRRKLIPKMAKNPTPELSLKISELEENLEPKTFIGTLTV